MADAITEVEGNTTGEAGARGGLDPRIALTGIALVIAALTLYAFVWQELRPYPGQEPTGLDWWRYPIERNAFLRIPVVNGTFNDLHAVPNSSHVWVVGDDGLILHSPDDGVTWRTVPLNAGETSQPVEAPATREPEPAEAAWRWPSLFEAAHAQAEKSSPTKEDSLRAKKEPARFEANQSASVQQVQPARDPLEGSYAEDVDGASKSAPVQQAPPELPQDQPDAFPEFTEQEIEELRRNSDPPEAHEQDEVAEEVLQPSRADLFGVRFEDEQRGVVETLSGERFETLDGGATWQLAAPSSDLIRGAKDSEARGWSLSSGDVALLIPEPLVVLARTPLAVMQLAPADEENVSSLELAFSPGSTRFELAVDGGEPATLSAPSPAGLVDVFFESRNRGWAATAGAVYETTDGAREWSQLDHSRAPAPWYYAAVFALLLVAASRVRVLLAPPVATGPKSIANVGSSDRPLQRGDPDALGLGRIAAGLSEFLRNANTEPPLTIAVTGAWGSGKSSLMQLLKGDLEDFGYRPVWFNAWHHQKGEHLLASLFANIRSQGIPPLVSPEGLAFRARLLWMRLKLRWLVAIGVIAAVTAVFSLANSPTGFARYTELLGTLVGGGEGAADRISSLLGLAPSAAALFALLFSAWRALVAFGLDPAKLRNAASADGGDKIEPGARFRFASEFKQVTTALAPRRLVIFIDDLDRCAQDHVVEVLEVVNFLSVSGDCFVVLGMEPTWVKGCVALAFKDLAHEAVAPNEDETSRNKRRVEFAERYLEKLINLPVPVPSPDEAGARKLLQPSEPARKSALPGYATAAGLAGVLVAAAWGGYALLGPELQLDAPSETPPPAETRGELVLADESGDASGARLSLPLRREKSHGADVVGEVLLGETKATLSLVREGEPEPADGAVLFPLGENGASLALQLPEEGADEAASDADAASSSGGETPALSQLPGDRGLALLWLPGVLLALAAGAIAYQWKRRPPPVSQDSPEFADALAIWHPWIAYKRPTPRSLKRFLNELRYTAIQRKHFITENELIEHESLLVARAAIESVASRPSRWPSDNLQEVAVDALHLAEESAPGTTLGLRSAIDAHITRFGDPNQGPPPGTPA